MDELEKINKAIDAKEENIASLKNVANTLLDLTQKVTNGPATSSTTNTVENLGQKSVAEMIGFDPAPGKHTAEARTEAIKKLDVLIEEQNQAISSSEERIKAIKAELAKRRLAELRQTKKISKTSHMDPLAEEQESDPEFEENLKNTELEGYSNSIVQTEASSIATPVTPTIEPAQNNDTLEIADTVVQINTPKAETQISEKEKADFELANQAEANKFEVPEEGAGIFGATIADKIDFRKINKAEGKKIDLSEERESDPEFEIRLQEATSLQGEIDVMTWNPATSANEKRIDKEIGNALTFEEAAALEKQFAKENKEKKTDRLSWLKNKVVDAFSGVKIGKDLKPTVEKLARKLLFRGIVVMSLVSTTPTFSGSSFDKTDSNAIEKLVLDPSLINPEKYAPDAKLYKELSKNGKQVYMFRQSKMAHGDKEYSKPYVIADKPSATCFVLDANNKLVASFPMITGAVSGEAPNIKTDVTTAKPGPYATTPMGSYFLTKKNIYPPNAQEYEGRIFRVVDPTGTLMNAGEALHETYPGELKKRTAAYKTSTPEDNKMSWGCINISQENFDKYLDATLNNAHEDYGLYILPDDPETPFSPAF